MCPGGGIAHTTLPAAWNIPITEHSPFFPSFCWLLTPCIHSPKPDSTAARAHLELAPAGLIDLSRIWLVGIKIYVAPFCQWQNNQGGSRRSHHRPPRLATLHADINILFQADVSPPCVDGVEDCSMQSGHVGMLRCQVLLLSPGNISWLALVRWRGSGDAGDCCYPPL